MTHSFVHSMFPMSTVRPEDALITENNIFPLGKIQCLILVGPEHSLSSMRNCQERFPDAFVTMYTIFFEDSSYNTSWYCITAIRYEFSALEILFIILSCLCDNFRGLPERAKSLVFFVFRYFCQIFFHATFRYLCWILIL